MASMFATAQRALVAICACAAVLGTAGVPLGAQELAKTSPALPDCTTATADAPGLAGVPTRLISVASAPFGVAVSKNGESAFVVVGDTIDVFSLTSKTPRLVEKVVLPFGGASFGPSGLSISPNGRYLAGALDSGAVIINVASAERGLPDSVLGTFTSGGAGAIEAAFSPDGNYVFVSLEDSDELAVFDLRRALAQGFGPADLTGMTPLEEAPVGIAIATNHRYLYATSETHGTSPMGTLTTIDLARAEVDPGRAVVSTVEAGCGAVRVVASSNQVFVTARESDALVEFSASALVSDPRHALVGEIRVGEAPVGLAIVVAGRGIVVADSNRFYVHGKTANLALVKVGAGGRLKLAGYVRSGDFPRDVAATPNGRAVLVSDYGSFQLEEAEVAGAL